MLLSLSLEQDLCTDFFYLHLHLIFSTSVVSSWAPCDSQSWQECNSPALLPHLFPCRAGSTTLSLKLEML